MTYANSTAIRSPRVAPHTPPATRAGARPTGWGMTPAQRETIQQLLFASAEPAHGLGEGIDRYRDEHLHVDGLAAGTVEWRERGLSRLADWRGRPLTGRFRDVAVELYRRHGDVAGSMAASTLARVLNLAASWGWRPAGHDLAGLANVRSRQRTQVVSAEHRPALLTTLAAEERPRARVLADVATLLLLTGMRVSEGCGVEWDHVSIADRLLMLPRTKSGRPRVVPLCPAALAIVDGRPRSSRWVFARHDCDAPVKPQSVRGLLYDACAAAGVPRCSPHILRHTWATEAMRAGVADEVAAKALGHSSTKQLNRYQHARTVDVEHAMLTVAAAIGGRR